MVLTFLPGSERLSTKTKIDEFFGINMLLQVDVKSIARFDEIHVLMYVLIYIYLCIRNEN